jgi:hypothetical protein
MSAILDKLSTEMKQIQVTWNAKSGKWYPVAVKLTLQMMTNKMPVEFATELLLPFTVPEIRDSNDPWRKARDIDLEKYSFEADIEEHCSFLAIETGIA